MIFVFIALIGCSVWIYIEKERVLTFFKSLTKVDYMILLIQGIIFSMVIILDAEKIKLESAQTQAMGKFCGILPLLVLIYLFSKHGLIKLRSGIYLLMNPRISTILLLYLFLALSNFIFGIFFYAFLKIFGIL